LKHNGAALFHIYQQLRCQIIQQPLSFVEVHDKLEIIMITHWGVWSNQFSLCL